MMAAALPAKTAPYSELLGGLRQLHNDTPRLTAEISKLLDDRARWLEQLQSDLFGEAAATELNST